MKTFFVCVFWLAFAVSGKYFVYPKEVGGKWGLYLYDIKNRTERLLVGG